jgi:tetratricopeptide (TPR) repeat protein
VTKFQAALDLDTGLDFDPDAKAKRIAVPALVRQGEQFVTDGKFEEAIATYTKAQTLDPDLEISSNTWNWLCWQGSLNGYAATVLDACEQAVELAPHHGGVRDSRGLARALTGDTAGAIADFQAFIDWDALDNFSVYKAKRQRWIEALRAGQNPFTPEELERLRNEG